MSLRVTKMNCPKCRGRKLITISTIHMVKVDCCKKCRGIWFESEELEEIFTLAKKDLKVSRDSIRQKFKCPKCTIPLYTFPYPHTSVMIDMCAQCSGIWLDHNELTKIQEERLTLYKKGRLPDVFEEEISIPEVEEPIKPGKIKHKEITKEDEFPPFEKEFKPVLSKVKGLSEEEIKDLFIECAYHAFRSIP